MSSAVAAAGHVFSTRWEWYWKDENNKWQSYDTPGDGHAVNTTSSQCFEREYQAGKVEKKWLYALMEVEENVLVLQRDL